MAELPSVQRLASYPRARTVRVTRADLRRIYRLQVFILALQLTNVLALLIVNITATLWMWGQ